jgi:hypothetical protein
MSSDSDEQDAEAVVQEREVAAGPDVEVVEEADEEADGHEEEVEEETEEKESEKIEDRLEEKQGADSEEEERQAQSHAEATIVEAILPTLRIVSGTGSRRCTPTRVSEEKRCLNAQEIPTILDVASHRASAFFSS